MEKNKKFIKSRTANKNSDKIRKIKININNRKKENSLNNKASNRKISSNKPPNIIFIKNNQKQVINTYNSDSDKDIKRIFELEYNKLENLCNKKSNRNKKEVKNFMEEQKKKMMNDKKQKEENNSNKYNKIFNNYRELEKEIKNLNITNKIKKEEKKIMKFEENNLKEISNGSINNKKFNNKIFDNNYYFGCLDVKKILSKHIIIKKNNEEKKDNDKTNIINNTDKK